MDFTSYAAWIELDKAALVHNLNILRQALSPGVEMRAVVKANAYGHGMIPVASILWSQGIRCFGVATLEEGCVLRRQFPAAGILLLGAIWKEHYRSAIENQLELMLHTVEHLPLLDGIAGETGLTARLHIKVDTGMGRNGLALSELPAVAALLPECSRVDVIGLCSHFATSGEPDSGYVRHQLAQFETARRMLEIPGLCLHMANSDALLAYPVSHYHQVRPGLALYGYCSFPHVPLRPVLSLRSRITHLKPLPKGAFLSYGRTFTTGRKSLIAVLPVGYADGVNRLLSNQQTVLVHGQRVPIVGRVTMDHTLIDVTGMAGVEIGTVTTLIGSDGQERITAREWAEQIGTIPYEVLTSLGKRQERLLLENSPGPSF